MRVLLACDRSGGHIFPALCYGKNSRKDQVCFFATSTYFKSLLEENNFKVIGTSFRFRNIALEGFFRFWEALYFIFKLRPKKVIGFGGRDTFFLIIWSRIFLIDTSIYEPNFAIGRANKILALFVKRIYCSFQLATKFKKVNRVGIPLRDDLKKLDKKEAKRLLGLDTYLPVILCFGGSQGSVFINQSFKDLVSLLDRDFQIIHITGSQQYYEFMDFYDRINKKARTFDFCRNMGIVYSSADLIISRAGALTLAEISFYRIPVILIPHPLAGAHQYENANYFKKRDACLLITQDNFSSVALKSLVENLLDNNELRDKLKSNLKYLNLAVSCNQFYKNCNL